MQDEQGTIEDLYGKRCFGYDQDMVDQAAGR